MEMGNKFVHTYLLEGETVLPIITRIEDLNEARKGGYVCCFQGCDSKYILHSARVKYVITITSTSNFLLISYSSDLLERLYLSLSS